MPMTKNTLSTSLGKKQFFDEMLSRELSVCKFGIMASYEWKRPDRICTVAFDDCDTVSLGINLNTRIETAFQGFEKAEELTALYRTYFISAYIRCLENASETDPDAYFPGLVTLDAIIDINCGKKSAVFTPLEKRTVSQLRAINVHCAICALNRICLRHGDLFSESEREQCEKAIDRLVGYTILPEVVFRKPGKPEYGILSDMAAIKEIEQSHRGFLKDYPIFSDHGITDFDMCRMNEICSREKTGGFWPDAVMRLLAFSDHAGAIDVTGFPAIEKSITEFRQKCVFCYRKRKDSDDVLTRSNIWAVKKTASHIEKTFFSDTIRTEALHFMM